MPGMRHLTIGAIKKAIDGLGGVGKATWAGVAQRTGHSLAEVKALGEKHGLSLRDRLSSPSVPEGAPVVPSGWLEFPGFTTEQTDLKWDPLSNKPPRLPRGLWLRLLSDWYQKNRDLGDRTPLDVLFREHSTYAELGERLAAAESALDKFRSEGAYARGKAEGWDLGFRKGSSEGLAKGWLAALSRVELTCNRCRGPVIVDFGVRDGQPTAARELLDGQYGPPMWRRPIHHVDCQHVDGGYTIAIKNQGEDRKEVPWRLVRNDGREYPSKTPFLQAEGHS